jgi:hypothetical protein
MKETKSVFLILFWVKVQPIYQVNRVVTLIIQLELLSKESRLQILNKDCKGTIVVYQIRLLQLQIVAKDLLKPHQCSLSQRYYFLPKTRILSTNLLESINLYVSKIS